jgi:hypothetical protein
LEDLLAEVSEEVTDRLLAVRDDVSAGGTVDGVRDAAAQLLEALAELVDQDIGRDGG